MPSQLRGSDNFDTGQKLTLGTSQPTTSGTAIDFTGIPSWVKRITVMFNGVSTNGTSDPMIQLRTAGGVVASGYVSAAMRISAGVQYTTGFGLVGGAWANTNVSSGVIVLTNLVGNVWSEAGNVISGSNTAATSAGSVTLASALTGLRITTVSGTDTFTAGSVNILYE